MAVILLSYRFSVEQVETNGDGKVILRGKNYLGVPETFKIRIENFPVVEAIKPGDNIARIVETSDQYLYGDLVAIEILGC